jgi:hypothetical protein
MTVDRETVEKALLQAWQMVDVLHPPGAPGSYARGEHNGIIAALRTFRDNLNRALAAAPAEGVQPVAPEDAFERGRQQGMKQELALWELARLGQEMGDWDASATPQAEAAGVPAPDERVNVPYCLACQKEGHRTTECWSTHGLNTPADWELHRLRGEAALAARDSQAQTEAAATSPQRCSYPDCDCPFDAPADPNWCARGLLPRLPAGRDAKSQVARRPAHAPAHGFVWIQATPKEWSAIADARTAGPADADVLAAVRQAVREYHQALDRRAHGGVAQDAAMHKIEAALGQPWVQGATLQGER